MTQALYDFLAFNNLETTAKATAAGIPVMLQSFSDKPMIRFATMSDLPRIQLLKSHYMPIDFDFIETYAHGVGVNTEFIMYWPYMERTDLFDPTTYSPFVAAMHKRNLIVHTYKHAQDALEYLPEYGTPHYETTLFAVKGCDAVFTEQVATSLSIWERMVTEPEINTVWSVKRISRIALKQGIPTAGIILFITSK